MFGPALLALATAAAPPVKAEPWPPPQVWNDVLAAPPAVDRFRFPDSPTCEAAVKFANTFRGKLNDERELWPATMQWRFELTLEEAGPLRLAWFHLSWAQWPSRAEWQRRLDLAKVRELIGPDAYDRGEMPPVVPSWRLRDY